MRNYLLTIVFGLATGMTVMGQETKVPDAFDCEDGCWVTAVPGSESNKDYPLGLYVYRSFNDTVIDGDTWHKMYRKELALNEVRTICPEYTEYDYGNAFAYTRKENDTVYIKVNESYNTTDFGRYNYMAELEPYKSYVLYDFSKDVGEYVEVPICDIYSNHYIKGYMEETSLCGYKRKMYESCIEGIGGYSLGPLYPAMRETSGFYNPFLLMCLADGEYIYDTGMNYFRSVYNVLVVSPYYTNPVWTIGRIVNDEVVSTYKLSKDGLGNIVSSIDPNVKLNIVYYKGKYYQSGYQSGIVIYDFSLQVGETFDNGTKSMTVTSVDTMMIEGFERPVLTFDNGEQWIDGLGSTRGLLSPVTEDSEEYEEVLLSCVAGETVMYVNPEYGSGINETEYLKSEIRLNGTVLEITAPEDASHTVSVYDAGGNVVVRKTFDGAEYTLSVSSLEHGVYIVAVDGIACGKIVL